MKPVSGKVFAKVLEKEGWILLRVAGSHYVYGKPGAAARISLPIHGNADLKPGLQRHFMKIAGLSNQQLK